MMGGETVPIKSDRLVEETAVETFHRSVRQARRRLAFQLKDYFNALEQLSEKEFTEVITELDGDGVLISEMMERYKRYKGL